MNRVVADSNVQISDIVFGGKPLLLLEMAEEGELELFISEPILSETFRILRDKFQRTDRATRSRPGASLARSQDSWRRPKP